MATDLGVVFAVPQHDLAVGRAGRIAQPLELEARVDVRQTAVTVLRNLRAIERLPTGGNDDVAHRQFDDFVFLIEADGVGRAELLAGTATLTLEPDARLGVQHRHARNGLRERHVDRLPRAHAGFEVRVQHFARALLDADAATGAEVEVDLPRLLPDLHFEIAHRTGDFLQFRVGQQSHVLVLTRFRHLRREDAGRAVERGKRLVKLGHVAADRRFTLHQHHLVTGVGQFQRGLQAGDAAADDQRHRIDVDVHRFQRFLELDPLDRRRDQRLGLDGRRRRILGHPRAVLADVGHLQQVRIETAVGTGTAEGLFVQVGTASGHDDTRQTFLLNVLLDHLLAEIRAHEFVIASDNHTINVLARPLRDFLHVHLASNVAAAVTHVDADFLGHRQPPFRSSEG